MAPMEEDCLLGCPACDAMPSGTGWLRGEPAQAVHHGTWQWNLGEVPTSPYWGQAVAIVTVRITFVTIGAAAARKFPVLIGKTTSVWHRWWTSLLTLYPTSADPRALRCQRRGPVVGLVVDRTALANHQAAVQPPQDDVCAGHIPEGGARRGHAQAAPHPQRRGPRPDPQPDRVPMAGEAGLSTQLRNSCGHAGPDGGCCVQHVRQAAHPRGTQGHPRTGRRRTFMRQAESTANLHTGMVCSNLQHTKHTMTSPVPDTWPFEGCPVAMGT